MTPVMSKLAQYVNAYVTAEGNYPAAFNLTLHEWVSLSTELLDDDAVPVESLFGTPIRLVTSSILNPKPKLPIRRIRVEGQ